MKDTRRIILASSNSGKVREIRRELSRLDVQVVSLDSCGDIAEPVEDGLTFADNAGIKAGYYSRATGTWCLADDSGLVVDALGGRPGVRSARYASDKCPQDADRQTIDDANNAKLLEELSGVEDDKRAARFVCCLVLSDGKDVLIETRGTVEGRIGHAPRGDNGFGYDPLFYVPDLGCTTAELSTEAKNLISHRGKAVRQFAKLLEQLLNRDGTLF